MTIQFNIPVISFEDDFMPVKGARIHIEDLGDNRVRAILFGEDEALDMIEGPKKYCLQDLAEQFPGFVACWGDYIPTSPIFWDNE